MNARFAQMNGTTVIGLVALQYGYVDSPESDRIDTLMNSIGVLGEWLQYSETAAFRGKTPVVGDTYDADADVFVSPAVAVPE